MSNPMLRIKQLDGDKIAIELRGSQAALATLICRAMVADQELAEIVLTAIPAYLDAATIPRDHFATRVLGVPGSPPG